MGTTLRPEISKKDKYWISRHRYYELKHFCLQYHEWCRRIQDLDSMVKVSVDGYCDDGNISKPVEKCVEERDQYMRKMDILFDAAKATDITLWNYIVIGVTEGVSYEYLYSRLGMPCSRDTYYDRYRRFFWLLDQTRN